jgi:hypothetical protein
MEAKEKANELVESFLPYSDYNECDVFTQRDNQLKNAKQCALICIDEMIETLLPYGGILYVKEEVEELEEVKQEINKL